MTTSQTEKLTNVNPDVASGTAQFLSPLVIDLEALVVNGKQAHWHLRGHNFIGVHELLDTLVADVQEWADLAAERVVALGLPVDSRLATVASKTSVPELSAGFRQSEETIVEVVAMLDAAIQTARTAVDELDEIDLNSQDVAVEIVRGLEKDRWLLLAHIAK
ncbi:Dps family protein [Paramicrobacterium chengjingii]|uniref:DNA starvation/stationary phase protection protein n=1 Tax=Paramicrobacterium chengjingii TaxID=2769067 RepID=A0ABX6YF20_9MICO|nr:DNA starvation/stationary phase protection protein [Microbacterium chengjingii]QPZ37051.1 DNA starvation/stationary phase protection protein [Microbacterium chengjingii]